MRALGFQRSVVTKSYREVLAPLVGGLGAAPAVQQVPGLPAPQWERALLWAAWDGRPVLREEHQRQWEAAAGIFLAGAEPRGCSPLADGQRAAEGAAAEPRPTCGLQRVDRDDGQRCFDHIRTVGLGPTLFLMDGGRLCEGPVPEKGLTCGSPARPSPQTLPPHSPAPPAPALGSAALGEHVLPALTSPVRRHEACV